jgi:hypothetical protein
MYAPGLLGRNCAIRRKVLEKSRGLEVPAATGTDYVLAKMLMGAGVCIRQEPQSRVLTDYPICIRSYVRQQRRWLRNVTVHGRSFGATNEMQSALRTSLVGTTMLLALLLVPFAGMLVAVPWLMLFAHGLFSRVRYLMSASALLRLPLTWAHIAVLPFTLLLDFLTWTAALLDYAAPAARSKW